MKSLIIVIVLSIVMGAVLACDQEKVKQCSSDVIGKAAKIAQEALSGGTNKDEMMKEVCTLMQKFISCVVPPLQGCGENINEQVEKVIAQFNADPYNCNVKLDQPGGGVSVVASLLTLLVSGLLALTFN